MPENPRIAVVGGGVAGIGTALAILRKVPKCQLTVYSERFSPDTTGDGAAGLWDPYSPGGTPADKIAKWSLETWDLFKLWKREGRNYVLAVTEKCISQQDIEVPEWKHIFQNFRHLTQPELKPFGREYRNGYIFDTLIARPFLFLPNLMSEISSYGGQFCTRKIYSLSDVGNSADIIVNCTGIGAHDVVPDHSVYPVRGQLIRVNAPWINYTVTDESEGERSYVIKNPFSVVLGGTAQENDWRTYVDPSDTESILRRTSQLIPSLKGAEIISEWVGLRPVRKEGVRIEKDYIEYKSKKIPVVHNYGHGGCGITLFWGCAQEAAQIAAQITHDNYFPMSKL